MKVLSIETNANDHSLRKKLVMILGLLLLMVSIDLSVPGQEEKGTSRAELMKLSGKLIGEGSNTHPIGPLKLVSYRVEELSLPRAMKVELRGRKVEVDKAWRVTLTGGPFPVRSSPAVIWIDDEILGYGAENEELTEISVITFDLSLLRDGGAISLSYGESKEDRMELPEKLRLIGVSRGERQ